MAISTTQIEDIEARAKKIIPDSEQVWDGIARNVLCAALWHDQNSRDTQEPVGNSILTAASARELLVCVNSSPWANGGMSYKMVSAGAAVACTYLSQRPAATASAAS